MKIINIDSLAYGGYGVGRIDSKVIFVSRACPGDTLKIDIYDERKRYAFGKIVEIITPAPKRIAPVCKYFGICGGCNYLNISYEEELLWKTEIFKTEFKKIFKDIIDIKDIKLIHDFESGNCLKYRRKIGLKISPPFIGFYQKSSHYVVDTEYCYLAKESLNEMLKNMRGLLLSDNYKNTLLNNAAKITLTDAGVKNITLDLNNGMENYDKASMDIMDKTGADNIFFESPGKRISRHRESSRNYFILKDKKFSHALPSFIQVNEEQNENIINIITGYIKNIGGGINFKNILDLYCGYGNITLFLAAYAKTVTGVESNNLSIKLGEKNLKLNDIKNINFIMSDVANFIEKAGKKRARYDLVVLDPPKAGIKGLVPKIAKLNPTFIIYVSCDTVTLLRDLKAFVKTGYTLEQINLIDMFPRTYHMEHIAFLSK